MSIREVARRIDVSPSHVSQVERGIGAFSVPVLYAVARELGISVHELLEPDTGPSIQVSDALGGVADTPVVLRSHERAAIQLESGPRWSRLTPVSEPDVEFLEVIYAPRTRAPAQVIQHEGREYGVVIEGELTVEVDGTVMLLQAGDSVAFDSQRPHRFWNESSASVRAIWFVRDRSPGISAPHA